MSQPQINFHNQRHDHRVCINKALTRAKTICREKQARFTTLRQRVLEIIWQSHQPMRAYQILSILRHEKDNAEPPTVYRALDFLLAHQLIHKIESLNAYIGCDSSNRQHRCQFLICSGCQQVVEMEDRELSRLITQKAAARDFDASYHMVEIRGLCSTCVAQ